MRERSVLSRRLILVCTLAAAATAVHARPADPDSTPSRYVGHGVDSGLVTVASPIDGRLWSAWSYRSGSESDIALSVRDAQGMWSEPVFLGLGDRKSEIDPALAFDAAGNLYVAHTVKETGQLLVTKLAAGATRMSSPVLVSGSGERAVNPSLMPTDQGLVVGYRVGTRVVLRLVAFTSQPFGIQDGPDGFPPTRNETEGDAEDGVTGIGL